MRSRRLILGLAVAFLLSACSSGGPGLSALGSAFTGCRPDLVAAWQRTSGVDQAVVSDYALYGTWEDIYTTGGNSLCWWNNWRRVHPSATLVLGSPMLPRDGSTLAEGARGDFTTAGGTDPVTGKPRHDYWKMVADGLIRNHGADAYLRIGWEFNGSWFPWAANPDPESFLAYWRLIVDDLRREQAALQRTHPEWNQGKHFTIVWNPVGGSNVVDARDLWPGSSYVDLVADDIYDRDWSGDPVGCRAGPVGYPIPAGSTPAQVAARQRFATRVILYGGGSRLSGEYWREWAYGKGKPFAVAEWGLSVNAPWSDDRSSGTDCHGGGDDPVFMTAMLDWLRSSYRGTSIAWSLYFQTDDGLVAGYLSATPTTNPVNGHHIAAAPRALAAFRAGVR